MIPLLVALVHYISYHKAPGLNIHPPWAPFNFPHPVMDAIIYITTTKNFEFRAFLNFEQKLGGGGPENLF